MGFGCISSYLFGFCLCTRFQEHKGSVKIIVVRLRLVITYMHVHTSSLIANSLPLRREVNSRHKLILECFYMQLNKQVLGFYFSE